MFRKILIALGASIGVVVMAAAIFVAARQHLRFNAPYPDVVASTDPAAIARGRYLVRDLVNCASCHGDTTQMLTANEGKDIPLSGGRRWDIAPGTFYAPNITADSALGVGKVSDAAITRALRYGVRHDGEALLPLMELQGLSDEDLRAVLSYLRTQAAVRNLVPPHRYTLLGKIVKATVMARPVGPTDTPPKVTPHGATVENGHYLVESVTLCWACHTERNPATGALTGPRFGGATAFEPSSDGHSWSPPNITSDRETGRLGKMSEDAFVARFRAGRLIPRFANALAGLSQHDRRRSARYLPLPEDRPGGPSGCRAAGGEAVDEVERRVR